MKVSYYPGCSLDGTAREYGESTEAVAAAVGVELAELADWNCCGASSAHATSDALALSLPARNLGLADRAGHDVMVPCAACYSRLKAAERALADGVSIDGVDGSYQGNFQVKHVSDYFFHDVGLAAITAKQVKSLGDLNPVCYYGCLVTRPPRNTGAADADNPETVDAVLQALGAGVLPWSFKTDCCGSGHALTLPEVARHLIRKLLDMAAEAGADSIVCSCPMCHGNLDSWQNVISAETGQDYQVPIFYFTELLGLAFGHPDVDKWLGRHRVDPRPLLRAKGLF